ncbi:MAG: hypothetical protein EBZ36_09205 [Acidobacteria bacterium]|nr:hypothetical protein [Acidobacteriota bacterium]
MSKRFLLSWALLMTGVLSPVMAQQSVTRDHLTENEVELVRVNQEIDLRTEVFVKAADRRLLVLTDPQPTQKKREEEVWGPLPKGTVSELLRDYKRILEELEEKLDDALNRDGKKPALDKALKKAKESAAGHLVKLRTLSGRLTDRQDQRALREAIEEAELVAKAAL